MPKMEASLVGSQTPLTVSLVVATPDHSHRGDHRNNFNNNNSSNNNNNNNSSSPNLNNNNFSHNNNNNSSGQDPPKEVSSKPQYSGPSQPSQHPSSPK